MPELHIIMTLQWTNSSGGLSVATYSDTFEADSRTRAQLWLDMKALVGAHFGAPPDTSSVLFFDVQPNVISV